MCFVNFEIINHIHQIGIIHSTYEAIEHMSTSTGGKGGLIVNISSVLGLDAMHSTPSYSASKHAVLGLMRSLGVSFIRDFVDQKKKKNAHNGLYNNYTLVDRILRKSAWHQIRHLLSRIYGLGPHTFGQDRSIAVGHRL